MIDPHLDYPKIANDCVFIFAGGEMPSELLKRAGIRFRTEEHKELPANAA